MYNINLNSAECLIKKTHLTYTDVINVCAETSVHVPHALGDYFFGVLVALMVGVLIGTVVFVLRV